MTAGAAANAAAAGVAARVPITTGWLAQHLNAELLGAADVKLCGVDSLEMAGPGDVTFIRDDGFASGWAGSKAAAAIVTRGGRLADAHATSDARPRLVVANADIAMIAVLSLFAPERARHEPGVHPSAVVDPTAEIDATASIGPCCVIGAGAKVCAGAILESNIAIGNDAVVGAGTLLHAGVVVGERCVIGSRCELHANVSIGADGFGYVPNPKPTGPHDAVLKIPHIGYVRVGDAVEIGANSCVDRGKFGATTIGDGTKIDNLVQIGHNCRIGKCCLICGHVGLSGSVTLGDGAILAGKVGVSDGITIGAGARVGANSGVMNDVPAGETWFGAPAIPAGTQRRNMVVLRDIADRMKALQKLVPPGGQ